MNYDVFARILNGRIFEHSKAKLLGSIANCPERYVGIFRPTRPKAKLAQNLLQSHEIRMGDAMEEVVECYLQECGYNILHNDIVVEGQPKKLDLHFSRGDSFFFAEMKMRDDHDSTKKRGQISDFRAKTEVLAEEHGGENLCAILFFVDPSLAKNKRYYQEQIENIRRELGVSARLLYGSEFFGHVLGASDVWGEIESHLRQWRNDIPDFPEVNFDNDPSDSASVLESLTAGSAGVLKKLFSNDAVRGEILPIIFPTGATLEIIRERVNNPAVRAMIESYIRQLPR